MEHSEIHLKLFGQGLGALLLKEFWKSSGSALKEFWNSSEALLEHL